MSYDKIGNKINPREDDRKDSPLSKLRDESKDEVQCPVCGYYCTGKGGFGCIDKPKLTGLDNP